MNSSSSNARLGVALHRYEVVGSDGSVLAFGSFKAPHAAAVIRHVRTWVEQAGALTVERLVGTSWVIVN